MNKTARSRKGHQGFFVTHGLRHVPEYAVWNSMKQRCHNPNHSGYYKYGERGVVVCERWRGSFVAFYEDMGPRPSPTHSIDRIENAKGYEPGNCRWATRKEQMNNQTKTHLLTLDGKTQSIAEWCRVTGLNKTTIHRRLNKGLPVEGVLAPSNRTFLPVRA